MAEDPLLSISRLGALSTTQTVSPNLHPGPLQGGQSPHQFCHHGSKMGCLEAEVPWPSLPGTLLLAASWQV